ncbi:MAG TPA: dihydrodipicolinate synthase family protein [Candidatus Saccharimonadales bacterium]|nr:dihydrodipicolinate synthase family protein [Candidatus Saccharimonadales bacterium]
MKIDFKGLFPATVLPMTGDAQIDEPGLRRYMRHIADTTIHGVALNVDTGEGAHLTHAERVRVVEIVVEEIGDRLPVIAGLPAQFTEQAVAFGRDYRDAGASALLVFPISAYQGLPLDPELVIRYHTAVGDGVGLPLVLFNLVPSLGGVLLPPEILERLCDLAPVVAIKEASFDAKVFVEVVAAVRGQRRSVAILTGDDPFIYESFVCGADGALLGFGAVPARRLANMVDLAVAGRLDEAKQLMDRLTPLQRALFAEPVRNYRARSKEALVMQGILERATVREPLLQVSAEDRAAVRHAMVEAGELQERVGVG